jgi:UDP-N-acetylmuramoyl-tripeptide--D-alanyl-D-alanine ligase
LWKIVNHKIWFLTAIWNQHLWLFWSEQNIITAKSEIQNNLINNNGVLYINWNNKYIRNIKFHNNINIVKYWNYEWVNARYNIIKSDNTSTLFNFCYKLNNELYTTNLVWEHNIINLTWVLACLYDLWFSTILIKKHIWKLLLPDNTLNITTMKSNIIIDDSYNLSYESLFSWLEVLKKYDKKQILILDDILELWKKWKEIHYEIWKKIASEYNNIRILYCGVNYKQDFIEWLTSSWFLQKNILSNIDIPIKNTVILFEWRKSYNFISKTKKLCR